MFVGRAGVVGALVLLIALSHAAYALPFEIDSGTQEMIGVGIGVAISIAAVTFPPLAIGLFVITTIAVLAAYFKPELIRGSKDLPIIGGAFRTPLVKGLISGLFGIDIDGKEKMDEVNATINIGSSIPLIGAVGKVAKLANLAPRVTKAISLMGKSLKLSDLGLAMIKSTKPLGNFVGKIMPKLGRFGKDVLRTAASTIGGTIKWVGKRLINSSIRLDLAHHHFLMAHLHIPSVDNIVKPIGNAIQRLGSGTLKSGKEMFRMAKNGINSVLTGLKHRRDMSTGTYIKLAKNIGKAAIGATKIAVGGIIRVPAKIVGNFIAHIVNPITVRIVNNVYRHINRRFSNATYNNTSNKTSIKTANKMAPAILKE